ncbi:MAG TPA: ACP S-malonyltransferase [Patescibacteria group bacterium]|nr:ACP S-malonyltransferase [Patescibacteria group bacterium]
MLAFVFPGQGSQAVGMGADLTAAYPVCRQTFAEADETLGFSLSRLCFEGPEQDLQLTANAQPAILTVSVAALRALAALGLRPALVAGHSLGEYSALVAAGALGFADAVALVRKRGLYMQEAVPVGMGAMAAIMGLDASALADLCGQAERAGDSADSGQTAQVVSPANMNAPGQTVISGHSEAVDRAIAMAQERGARRAVRLQVSAPFHCVLMQPAADRLAADLAATRFNDLSIPLVANVTATELRTGEQARSSLVRQVTAPVLWEQSVRRLHDLGAHKALEVGPGKVLTGLIKRIEPGLACAPAGDTASIAAAKEFVS